MFISDRDTIAAISTAVVNSGISIIRISGEDAFPIADKVFKGKQSVMDMTSHTVNYGKFISMDGEVIDEILLLKLDGPKTYTRENTVEINCHGGVNVTNNVFHEIVKAGARIAEPGEFTKRAFLNGRIDLSQAEAVMDLINAQTDTASKIAIAHLQGKFSSAVKEVTNRIVDVSAEIEYHIEFNDDDMDGPTMGRLVASLTECSNRLKKILDTYDTGKIHREGINVVIAGRPNTGKSSLMNEVLGSDRAIVTDIPGTTRDIIQDYANINGIFVNISDSAGIRETGDVIEKIGIGKSYEAAKNADLILYMLDLQSDLNSEDIKFLEMFKDKNILIILNKTDLVSQEQTKQKVSAIRCETRHDPVTLSLKSGQGIEGLYERFKQMLHPGQADPKNQAIVTNVRHKNSVQTAYQAVNEAIRGFKEETPVDLITIDLNIAVHQLGLITGETASDDIIDRIFSSFCVGK
ncbi:MAG TPA: tRNA uridine-5-carboxymethylaminomethyl(34) synthesis GTPase MnmE [Clostridiales bacterium]|nr:tRNA uridine-5-carboxymethylaminomethyl(34) synthesis GTPase MnmE [Clostridiales bacterium]